MTGASPTPACRNALRRAGTNNKNAPHPTPPSRGEGEGGGDDYRQEVKAWMQRFSLQRI